MSPRETKSPPAWVAVSVWDAPVRLFHWALVAVVATLVATGKGLGDLEWHVRAGYVALALVLFRVLWGLGGNTYARLSRLVASPGATLAFARQLFSKAPSPWLGHNPLAGWNALALLCVLLAQAVTGLFASDDVATEGPLTSLVSTDRVEQLTHIHHLLADGLFVLIAMHLGAIVFHAAFKHENVVTPMLTGVTRVPPSLAPTSSPAVPVNAWRGLALLALAGVLVYWVVSLGG